LSTTCIIGYMTEINFISNIKNIAAIGEIIFDIYPGNISLGGAPLNFIYHIKKLTGNGTFISRLGNDNAGIETLEFLGKNNIPITHIQIDKNHETGFALANLDDKKVPHWEIPSGKAYDYIDIPDGKDFIIKNSSCFYFGTLAQRMERSRITIHSFFGQKMKYFFDINIRQDYFTKDILKASLIAADVLKANEDEIYLLHTMFLPGKFDLNSSVKSIMGKFNIELTAITQGDKGAWLFRNNESNFYKASIDKVVDTTGAGDAYSAILCLGYLNNMKLNKINKLASEFASEIVRIQGAIPKDDKFYHKFKQFFISNSDI
jgi:fructokinase